MHKGRTREREPGDYEAPEQLRANGQVPFDAGPRPNIAGQ